MTKGPDLSDITYQLRRAREYLADIEAEIDDIVESNHDSRADDSDLRGEHPNIVMNYPSAWFEEVEATEQAPQSIRGKVGEFTVSLRAALNYMTILLAKHDSGSDTVNKSVQFPMEDSRDKFTCNRKTRLKGISDEHVSFFEQYQPYNGCDWMKLLHTFSNTNKHLALVVVKTHYIRAYGTAWAEFEGEGIDAGRDVPVEKSTAEVSFPDRTPVIDTLERMHVQVTEAFKAFKALLGG
jgi:hypothetical protein